MALSPEDKAELISLWRNECPACPLSPETQAEAGHFFGRIKDIGKGNLNEGIETFSDAVEMVASIRSFGARVGGTLAMVICLALAGGVGTVLVLGLKAWFKRVIGGE